MSKRGRGFSLREKIFIGIIAVLVILLVGSLTAWFGFGTNYFGLSPCIEVVKTKMQVRAHDGPLILHPNKIGDIPYEVASNGNIISRAGEPGMAWQERPQNFYLSDNKDIKLVLYSDGTYEKYEKNPQTGVWEKYEQGTWNQEPKVD